jgi:hypothetical protein
MLNLHQDALLLLGKQGGCVVLSVPIISSVRLGIAKPSLNFPFWE